MAVILIRIEVDDVDPTLEDPENVADYLIDDDPFGNQNIPWSFTFLTAEWEG